MTLWRDGETLAFSSRPDRGGQPGTEKPFAVQLPALDPLAGRNPRLQTLSLPLPVRDLLDGLPASLDLIAGQLPHLDLVAVQLPALDPLAGRNPRLQTLSLPLAGPAVVSAPGPVDDSPLSHFRLQVEV